jgi:hypothetical protein
MSESQDAGLGSNPYRSPFSVSEGQAVGDESGQVMTHKVLSMLRQTQPWVRFLSVLGIIIAALMVLVGSFGFVAMTFASSRTDSFPFFLWLVYIAVGVLYFLPALLLFRYASRINDLWTNRSVRALEDALEAQKSFWKFVGILMLVVIVLYLLVIVFAFMAGAMHAH